MINPVHVKQLRKAHAELELYVAAFMASVLSKGLKLTPQDRKTLDRLKSACAKLAEIVNIESLPEAKDRVAAYARAPHLGRVEFRDN